MSGSDSVRALGEEDLYNALAQEIEGHAAVDSCSARGQGAQIDTRLENSCAEDEGEGEGVEQEDEDLDYCHMAKRSAGELSDSTSC